MIDAVIAIVFVAAIGLWTVVRERRHAKDTLTVEADTALRTVRQVAKQRAKRVSLPIPVADFEDTPVYGVPYTGVASVTPIKPQPNANAYSHHVRRAKPRRGGNPKVAKR